MPVPKRKRSKSRRDKRFANKGITPKPFIQCTNCQEPIAPHQACLACGFYKGKKILATKIDKKVKRAATQKNKQSLPNDQEQSVDK